MGFQVVFTGTKLVSSTSLGSSPLRNTSEQNPEATCAKSASLNFFVFLCCIPPAKARDQSLVNNCPLYLRCSEALDYNLWLCSHVFATTQALTRSDQAITTESHGGPTVFLGISAREDHMLHKDVTIQESHNQDKLRLEANQTHKQYLMFVKCLCISPIFPCALAHLDWPVPNILSCRQHSLQVFTIQKYPANLSWCNFRHSNSTLIQVADMHSHRAVLTVHLLQSQSQIRWICKAYKAITLRFSSALITNNLQPRTPPSE